MGVPGKPRNLMASVPTYGRAHGCKLVSKYMACHTGIACIRSCCFQTVDQIYFNALQTCRLPCAGLQGVHLPPTLSSCCQLAGQTAWPKTSSAPYGMQCSKQSNPVCESSGGSSSARIMLGSVPCAGAQSLPPLFKSMRRQVARPQSVKPSLVRHTWKHPPR